MDTDRLIKTAGIFLVTMAVLAYLAGAQTATEWGYAAGKAIIPALVYYLWPKFNEPVKSKNKV